jgi:diguanylate cyclase (GGDEF)-like protein
MKGYATTIRIAISLTGLSVGLFLSAHLLGLIPDERAAILRGRSKLCESMAISFSTMAEQSDTSAMQLSMQAIQHRNPEILSVGIRQTDGELLAQSADHESHWRDPPEGRSTETHMHVPITRGNEPWGALQVSFEPIDDSVVSSVLGHPIFATVLYLFVTGVVAYMLFLRRILSFLNPSKAVPGRVRSALDTLAEGLLVLDARGRIVLANKAFREKIKRRLEQLVGCDASRLPWLQCDEGPLGGKPGNVTYPWSRVLGNGAPCTGTLIKLRAEAGREYTFQVNATPILDGSGSCQGVLASFEDITDLEQKRVQMSDMLDQLRKSSKQIQQQNKELERLATSDPLTACLNRRSFFEQFESQWTSAHRYQHPLSCVMIDIDQFKSINDTFGHQTGDEVLQKVAQVLQTGARDCDIVCRYGGEEFVLLLPHLEIEDATSAAERLRGAIKAAKFPNMTVTASLGVSALSQGAHDPQALLEQADKSMYLAKRNGRDQVVRWDEVPQDAKMDSFEATGVQSDVEEEEADSIPFQAVTALISSLAYRDLDTAEHSRRVADLCVATAEGLMSLRDCYVLENASLLHDIGKVGVPDAILLKPDNLTDDEWKVMRRHERVGVEIVEASFNAKKLTTILANQRAYYGGSPNDANLPRGTNIPLGSRILNIADAYDSMVTDRPYRKGRSPREAYKELRRCAGSQFDPELVERFIQTVSQRTDLREGRVPGVSKKAAGSFGRQIGRLVAALDNRDTAGLHALAGRLRESATKHGVSEVAEKAGYLEEAAEANQDAIGILKAANELIDLCRATQGAYLEGVDSVDSAADQRNA